MIVNTSDELGNRIMCVAARGQYALGRILRAKNIVGALKICVYKAILSFCISCETWTMTQADDDDGASCLGAKGSENHLPVIENGK